MQFDVTSWKNVTRLFDFGPQKERMPLIEKQPPQLKCRNAAQIRNQRNPTKIYLDIFI